MKYFCQGHTKRKNLLYNTFFHLLIVVKIVMKWDLYLLSVWDFDPVNTLKKREKPLNPLPNLLPYKLIMEN